MHFQNECEFLKILILPGHTLSYQLNNVQWQDSVLFQQPTIKNMQCHILWSTKDCNNPRQYNGCHAVVLSYGILHVLDNHATNCMWYLKLEGIIFQVRQVSDLVGEDSSFSFYTLAASHY